MTEVQEGRMHICSPSDSPIPPSTWKNNTPIRSQFVLSLDDHTQNQSIATGFSSNRFSGQGHNSHNVLPPPETDIASLSQTTPTKIFAASSVNRSSSQENESGKVSPPLETLAPLSYPTAGSIDMAVPAGGSPDRVSPAECLYDQVDENNGDENYPSPVSFTNLDWEFSQEGSDQDSSDDFVRSEDYEEESSSSSKSG